MTTIVVERKMRGFISLTAHPDGCARNVAAQVGTARTVDGTLANALVLGSSTGYGLASTLVATFGLRAATLGVCFERPPQGEKTATAGWYNLAEAHRLAAGEGRHLETINADAFSAETKRQVVDALRERYGQLDLIVYSLAAPRRTGPSGESWTSVLKPVGTTHSGKGIDLRRGTVTDLTIEPATDDELAATIKVMGGEDWADWIDTLAGADLLAPGCRAVAYSYIGPDVTAGIYRDGTIGHAKAHLEQTAHQINQRLAPAGGGAWIAVNKCVVTQASSAIPAVPLYFSILQPVMEDLGLDEQPIDQIVRLVRDHLGPGATPTVDDQGRIRLDEREMSAEVQTEVSQRWDAVSTATLEEVADVEAYTTAFNQLFGFDVDGVDEQAPTEIDRPIPGVGP